jgi:DnaJ-class molecular chaperone
VFVKELKASYRKLCLIWHPGSLLLVLAIVCLSSSHVPYQSPSFYTDKNPTRQEEALVRFKELQNSYAVLTDPNERAWYATSVYWVCAQDGQQVR